MIHLVSVSGGITSWAEAKLVALEYGQENVELLFCDTLVEDPDVYRFLIEGAFNVFGRQAPNDVLEWARHLPSVVDTAERTRSLADLRYTVSLLLPELHWVADGRDLWSLFRAKGFIGNHRADLCSQVLKRQVADKFIKRRWSPDGVVVYVGMTADEEQRKQRFTRLRDRKLPFVYRCLLIERGMTKGETLGWAKSEGIAPPSMYARGHSHANCGGACIKQGHSQWLHLLTSDRETYLWWENSEEAFRTETGKNVSILKDRRRANILAAVGHMGGKLPKSIPLTLRDLRLRVEGGELTAEDHYDLDEANPCGDSCVAV